MILPSLVLRLSEFKEQYEDSDSNIKHSLNPAKEFVSGLKGPELGDIMNSSRLFLSRSEKKLVLNQISNYKTTN
jgi:hypothetical protein